MKHTWNDKPVEPEDTPWLQEDGVHKIYYESGALRFEYPYINGQVHGIYKSYYESGALKYEEPYVNGQAHGVHKAYYESGALRYEWSYINGQAHGVCKAYSESGALMYETPYVNGKSRSDLKNNRLAQVVLFGETEAGIDCGAVNSFTELEKMKNKDAYDEYMETCRLRVIACAAIENAMEKAGLSREDLASKVGYTPGYIQQVLDGEVDITLEHLAKYGLACDVRWKFVGVDATDSDRIIIHG